MPAQHDLKILLQSMSPELHGDVFVFCSGPKDWKLPSGIEPQLLFREEEGITMILRQAEAEALHLPYQFPSRMITLTVHSALDAVGFIASVASCLAEAGISTNPVSGYYHDHLFVPADRADDAMAALIKLGQGSGRPPNMTQQTSEKQPAF